MSVRVHVYRHCNLQLSTGTSSFLSKSGMHGNAMDSAFRQQLSIPSLLRNIWAWRPVIAKAKRSIPGQAWIFRFFCNRLGCSFYRQNPVNSLITARSLWTRIEDVLGSLTPTPTFLSMRSWIHWSPPFGNFCADPVISNMHLNFESWCS